MARIAAIVFNSVSHDARVLKEADSLAAAGHEVTIFGVQDERCSTAEMSRPSGVRIRLCDSKRSAYRLLSRSMLAAAALLPLAFLAVLVINLDRIETLPPRQVALFAGIALAAGIALPLVGLALRLRTIAGQLGGGARPDKWLTALRNTGARLIAVGVRKHRILRLLREFEPDAVHCHDLHTLPVGHAYARRARCPIVFDSHELFEELSQISPSRRRLARLRQRYYSSRVDAFVTVNDSIAGHLRRKYPRLPPAIVVKNAALLTDGEVADDGRLRRAARLDGSKRILLYQGGYARFRGLEALVRAAALLPEEWCLVMMGWGSHEPVLRGIAASGDATKHRVRFIPAAAQRELAQWTAGAALGVIAYENVCLNHWFCTPNKLWEYPVAGVPLLASPFPELAETVRRHGIGRLLPDPATPEGIASTVASITDDELAAMKRACREFIRQDNWSVYERRLVDLYGRLMPREHMAGASAPERTAPPEERQFAAAIRR